MSVRTLPALRVALAAAAVAVAVSCAKEPAYEKPLTPVTVAKVESFASGTAVRYSATVKPAVEVVVAFKAGGYVDQIMGVSGRLLQEGDRVSKGAALARVRQSDYEQRLAQARSGLAEAEAMHESARLNFERASRLFERRSLTKPELDGAKAQFDASAAKVAGARAMVNETQIVVDDVTLRSPIDGVVLKRSIEYGSLVAPGTPAFTLADTRSVKVVFGVPDVVVKTLKIGRVQRVAFEALGDQSFEGRITAIAPSPDPVSRAYEIELTVPNERRQIEVGFIASLELEGDTGRSVAAIPLEAVVKPSNKSGANAEYAVFVVDEQKDKVVARLRPIKLGEALGQMIVVAEGLTVGQRVIVRGATLVSDGETVRLLP